MVQRLHTHLSPFSRKLTLEKVGFELRAFVGSVPGPFFPRVSSLYRERAPHNQMQKCVLFLRNREQYVCSPSPINQNQEKENCRQVEAAVTLFYRPIIETKKLFLEYQFLKTEIRKYEKLGWFFKFPHDRERK